MEQEPSYVTHLLAYHCMPTLLKMKPASLICIHKTKVISFGNFNEEMKQELKTFKCQSMLLYENSVYQMLLIYNRKLLDKVLRKKKNLKFLQDIGYRVSKKDTVKVLETLRLRYQACKENLGHRDNFPHEIGIILGYPEEDVRTFSQKQGNDYLLCGAWKVYHNERSARKIFDSYKRSRERALAMVLSGKNLSECKKLLTRKMWVWEKE